MEREDAGREQARQPDQVVRERAGEGPGGMRGGAGTSPDRSDGTSRTNRNETGSNRPSERDRATGTPATEE